jgi:hypothetical protein
MSAGRLEVLAALAGHAADLREEQAVALLTHFLRGLGDDVLVRPAHPTDQPSSTTDSLIAAACQVRYCVEGGLLRLRTGAEPGPESAVTSATPKKSKKTAAKKTGAAVPEPASVAAAVVAAGGRCSPAAALSCLVGALTSRHGGFSADVLADCTRALPLATVCLLLRAFALFVRGLEARAGPDAGVPEGGGAVATERVYGSAARLTDVKLSRAFVWIQALVDGHFSELAMNAGSDGAVKHSLKQVMDILADIDKSVDSLESALGVSTHIVRMSKCNNEGLLRSRPPTGMYQIEKLHI